MLSDQLAIQGLWRVVSCVARGRPVGSATTHYQFDGNRVKQIVPSRVNSGDWATFGLDPAAQPKRFTMISETVKAGKTARRVDRWLYELDGDTLQLCWPRMFGDYPETLSDQIHGVVTLARDPGPPPKTKQASGKKPMEDPVLGRLTWNDNHDWWETRFDLKPDLAVFVHLRTGKEKDDTTSIARGREFACWLRQHEQSAREFAAAELIDTHNDSWNDGEPISASTFLGRTTLKGVGFDPDRGATLHYDDGDLFGGHSIIVSVDENREFRDATLAG